MRRVTIQCQLCGEKTYLNAGYCVLHVFIRQPAFSWYEVICQHCENEELDGSPQEFFFDPKYWRDHLPIIISAKVGIIEEEWVDDKTYAEYLDKYGEHLAERELTDQDEKNVKFLAWLLNHYDTRFFDDPQRGGM